MGKRKRLTPARSGFLGGGAADSELISPVLETKSALPSTPRTNAPISQIAGDSAAVAALAEVSQELQQAREQGRMVLGLATHQIEETYLVRDRLQADKEALGALMQSLAVRGQQTPIEVADLGDGRYGLISGWRRLMALRQLFVDTDEARFGQVLCLLRRPENASDAYVAMVEENEIRVGLSYYERARIAARVVEQGVYDSEKAALLALFSTASRSKRSKIRSFLAIYYALDSRLNFPHAIPERLGLAVSKVITSQGGRGQIFAQRLAQANPQTAEDEAILLGEFAGWTKAKSQVSRYEHLEATQNNTNPEIAIRGAGKDGARSLTLRGTGITAEFEADLRLWIVSRA